MSPNDIPYPTSNSHTLTIDYCPLMPRWHTVHPQPNHMECEQVTTATEMVHAIVNGQAYKKSAMPTQVKNKTADFSNYSITSGSTGKKKEMLSYQGFYIRLYNFGK